MYVCMSCMYDVMYVVVVRILFFVNCKILIRPTIVPFVPSVKDNSFSNISTS